MGSQKETSQEIVKLKDGEFYYFNMSEGGGAVCHKCNGMYLLFEVPMYGGEEQYIGTYFENQINNIVSVAYNWS